MDIYSSTVATLALGLECQNISTNSCDYVFFVLERFDAEYLLFGSILEKNYILEKI